MADIHSYLKPGGISVRNLAKCFRVFPSSKHRAKQLLFGSSRRYYQEFWALRDVTFDLRPCEALGIIGRNGSGKSTLLQLISGTLMPTEGDVRVNGRIAALLELGSGFNPDFTGIENIYLNASLYGLRRREVEARLDDILAFADIGDFVYQPVRTYSSGMAVRLAFAIIAHLDADILIVDEALAVGDAFFTQKCMRYIHRFREHGSLLFVSHDASAITALCDRSILLNQGRLQMIGQTKDVTEAYAQSLYELSTSEAPANRDSAPVSGPASSLETSHWLDYRTEKINHSNLANFIEITQFTEAILASESFGNGVASLQAVTLCDAASGRPLLVALGGERVLLRIEGLAHQAVESPIIGFILKNDKGIVLLGDNTNNMMSDDRPAVIEVGCCYSATFDFTLPLLPAGNYSVTASLAAGTQAEHIQLHWVNDALIFKSCCTSIAAGLAGVAMHAISLDVWSAPHG